MNPNIAWKVNDFLSLGAGISVQYAKAELGMGLKESGMYLGHGKIEGDSWDWGYNLGIMISRLTNYDLVWPTVLRLNMTLRGRLNLVMVRNSTRQ